MSTTTATLPISAAAMPAHDARALTLSATDLARELRVSVKTVTRMDQSGKMPAAIRVGHGKRWLRSTIVAWLAAGCPSRRGWETAGLPPESSCLDTVGAPSATELRCRAVTAKTIPATQPVGLTPLLGYPRIWDLFRFILSKQICEQFFDAEHEHSVAEYQRARNPRYNTPWTRRWLNFAFAWRTVALIARCARPAFFNFAFAVILWFLPPRIKEWLFRLL